MPYFKLGMDKKVIVPYQGYLNAIKPDFDFIGDTDELKDLVRCLFLPNANSVKLVGRRGVGVTSLTDGLVQHQHADFMPDEIMIRPIYKLNAGSLFNTSDSKMIETRFRTALEELKRVAHQRKIKPILIMDDGVSFVSNAGQHVINALVEADTIADYVDLIIGIDEKKIKDFDAKHPAFSSSFTTKTVGEPKKDALFEIVKHHAQKHKEGGVLISDSTVQHIIDITQRFQGMYDTAQPNRAIRLLDSAGTAFRLEIHSQPPGLKTKMDQLEELEVQLSLLEGKPEGAERIGNDIEQLQAQIDHDATEWREHRSKIKETQENIRKFDRMIAERQNEIDVLDEETKENSFNIARGHMEGLSDGDEDLQGKTKDQIMALDRDSLLDFIEFDMNIARNPKVPELTKTIGQYTQNIEKLQESVNQLSQEMHVEEKMSASFVEDIASAQTKTPVGGITGQVNKNIRNGVALMKESVFGQDELIETVIASLRRSASGMGDPNRPLGVFLVAGPPGNGKTHTGKELAKKIFGSEDFSRLIPMGSFKEKHTVSKLISAPPGYAGYEEKSLFAEIGQSMPFGVLILDEIEKAHPDIRQAMLEILSTGKFEALNGDKADFRNIVILATSNYAQDVWLDNEFATGQALFMERIRGDVQTFSPEYLDRHDAIICTKPSDERALVSIVTKELEEIKHKSARKHPDLHIDIKTDDISAFISEHCLGKSGRHAKRAIGKVLGDPLSGIKLDDANANGIVKFTYNIEKQGFIHDYARGQKPNLEAANQNKPVEPGASEAFSASSPGLDG